MNKEIFYNQLKTLNEQYNNATFETEIPSMLAIEDFLKDQLKLEPRNTEVWLRLAKLEYIPPLQNPPMIISCLENILVYDSFNIDALIFISYVHHIFSPAIPVDIFIKLCELKIQDPERATLVELMKALYYKEKQDDALYEKCLLTAIDRYPSFASHYFDLGRLYIKQGFKEEGRKMVIYGLNNLKHVYVRYSLADITDIEQFYDEHLRGTHIHLLKVCDIAKLL